MIIATLTVFVLLAACVIVAGVFEGNKQDRERTERGLKKGKS